MRRALLLLAMVACGGRTGLRGENAADAGAADDASVESTVYKVIYTARAPGVEEWRSATSTLELISDEPAFGGELISCTYDGRFVAVQRDEAPGAFDVLDASGAIVRTQNGRIGALRPDGQRALVGGVHDGCVGTLDADGTYADVRCVSSGEGLGAIAYAPDGQTVLWVHTVYDPVTTDGTATYELATEHLTNERVLMTRPPGATRVVSPSFSFDGSRLGYADCAPFYDMWNCSLMVLRLDTLEATTVVAGQDTVRAAGFTPDGALVYLRSYGLDEAPALRRVDADGAVVTLADPSLAEYQASVDLCVARDVP